MRRALLAKDLRLHALVFVPCAVAMTLGAWLSWHPRFLFGGPLLLAAVGLPLTTVLLTVTLFAAEASTGTQTFLLTFPVRRRTVWWGRALLAAAYTVAVTALCMITLHHSLQVMPGVAAAWSYCWDDWALLVAMLRTLPFAVPLVFALAVAAAPLSPSLRVAWVRWLAWVGVAGIVYLALTGLSGTLPYAWWGRLRLLALPIDWLTAFEVVAGAVLAATTGLWAWTRTAPLEHGCRLRRARCRLFPAWVVAVILVAPFHWWINRPRPSGLVGVWPVKMTDDGNKLLMAGNSCTFGRPREQDLWVADLERHTMTRVAGSGRVISLEDQVVTLEPEQLLPQPRWLSLVQVDLRKNVARRLVIPGLQRAPRLWSRVHPQHAFRPGAYDLLFLRRRRRGHTDEDLWHLSSDGKRLSRVITAKPGERIGAFFWHPSKPGAYAWVTDYRTRSWRRGLWWIPFRVGDDGRTLTPGPPRQLCDHERYNGFGPLLSPNGEWLCLSSVCGAPTLGRRRPLAFCRYDGTHRWEVDPGERALELGTSVWTPEGARSILVAFCPGREQVAVSLCDVKERSRRDVALFPHHLSSPRWVKAQAWLSPDEKRVMVYVVSSNAVRKNPRSTFSASLERLEYALYEVDLGTGAVVTVRTARVLEREATFQEGVGMVRYDERRPLPVGYDPRGRFVVVENRSVVRLSPVDRRAEVVVDW